MVENLLDPLFLFFAVGFLAGVLKSDLKLPDAVYQLLSTYLLLAIGLKGGVQLAIAPPANVVGPALGALGLGAAMALGVFYAALRLGRWNRADSAALSAHYGSASAVTFAAALAMLHRTGVEHEGFLPVLLVIMEVPAIIVAVFLHRLAPTAEGRRPEGYGRLLHEVVLNRSVFLLLAGLAVGLLSGPQRFAPFEPLFVAAFKPILAFFVLEMGLLAAHRLPELRRSGLFLLLTAMVVPLVGGLAGGWVGVVTGLTSGGAIVLATLTASASYIAAPAAVRVAIPEANVGACVAAALGLTFPFNLAIGIPTYAQWVTYLRAPG
ncbi:MAG: sodium-dependent bicarbonate transport family permease [Opitutaceae bacterium]|nr:sodium-dependent bicarbonate transport family permease [Opitutaceae bacterium]